LGNTEPLASAFPRQTANRENLKSLRLAYCLAAFAAFLGGVAVYALFRDTGGMALFNHFPHPPFPSAPRIQLGTETIFGYFLVFNMTHGLWCLSALLVVRAVWLAHPKWRAAYGGIFIAAASGFELLQLNENVPGTFDALDLASYGIFAFLESVVYNTFTRRRVL